MTGLGIVVLCGILVLSCGLLIFSLPGRPTAPEGGIVPGAVHQTGDQLNVFGSIDGYPAVTGSIGGTQVLRHNPDPGRLGCVGMTLSLFLWSSGGVAMEKTTVIWTDPAGTEILPLTKEVPLVCPNWTITKKYHINPFKPADKDDVLEAGEQFEVLVCPSDTLPPYEEFTIIFDPPGSGPRFPVKCTVPFMITTTMVL